MNIQSKVDIPLEEIKSKYFQISEELERTIKQANQEIEDIYERCKYNKKFGIFDSLATRKWYWGRLKERIKRKIYKKYNINLFGSVSKIVETILPLATDMHFEQFTDVRNVDLGDKNEFRQNQ